MKPSAEDQKLASNVRGLLSDLVTKESEKTDLLIGAKVVRLAKSMNVFDSSMEQYEAVLKGDNKYKEDFCKALEELRA